MLIRDDMVLAGGSKTSCSQEKLSWFYRYMVLYIYCVPPFLLCYYTVKCGAVI